MLTELWAAELFFLLIAYINYSHHAMSTLVIKTTIQCIIQIRNSLYKTMQ